MSIFTPEHELFRETVRRFVTEEINPHVEEWERAGLMPLHEIFAKMAALGMLGVEYDPSWGGGGADHGFTVVLAEELGRADHGSIGMATGVQVDMATPSLAAHGSDALREEFLAPALRGEQVAAIAVTEPDAGSDVASVRTTARRDGDDWVINGAKLYITNALQADWLCLLARTSDEGGHEGMSQIIVPTDTPGFQVDKKLDKLGMRASDTGLLSFTDVRVPLRNTIGDVGRGFQQQMGQFVVERMWATYSGTAAFRLALERTRDYLQQRTAFGKPLMANQYLQYTLADLSAEVDLLQTYNHVIAERYEAGEDVTRMATIAKLKTGKLAKDVGHAIMQFHGGIGYMEETWTSRWVRDNRLVGIGGGADEVMLRVLSVIDGFTAPR